MISKARNQSGNLSLAELCKVAGVSRTGFYQSRARTQIESPDEKLIESIFMIKNRKAGARKIRMYLQRNHGLVVNLKKIRRIMRRRNLVTQIRKRRVNYQLQNTNHKAAPNKLNQDFKVSESNRIFSTDITYLNYNNGERAFLSAVKDLGTKEIVHFEVSKHFDISLVTRGLSDFLKRIPRGKQKIIIHSDQGAQYTSDDYRKLLASNSIEQSMSRKGNCLDNAPIESFFGHFKDESEYKKCKSFEELKKEVEKYMYYYNNERPQWGLKGKTPVEFRGFLN